MFSYLWKHRKRDRLFSRRFARSWAKRFLTFPQLVAASLRRGRLTSKGAAIELNACIGKVRISGLRSRLRVGASSFVGRATIALHDDLTIGACVCINDGVQIHTATHDLQHPNWVQISKPVFIDDYAWIATGAVILPGVKVGRGAVVGAGAVVAKNVPDYAVAVGNPAVIKLGRRSKDLAYSPVKFLAFQNAWLD